MVIKSIVLKDDYFHIFSAVFEFYKGCKSKCREVTAPVHAHYSTNIFLFLDDTAWYNTVFNNSL